MRIGVRPTVPSGADGAELPVVAFASKDAFEAWLEATTRPPTASGSSSPRRARACRRVVHAEAVDVALCFGWIDGQRKSLDETYYLQRFTPRRARSKWSKINVGKAPR